MTDIYSCFAELDAAEPDAYQIECVKRGTGILFIAPHGGMIEPLTSELAMELTATHHSYYAFCGKKFAGHNSTLHITSTKFDEPIGLHMVKTHRKIIAIHGCADTDSITYIGGYNTKLGRAIAAALNEKEFETAVHPKLALRGMSMNNICNKGTHPEGGVQLELAYDLRQTLQHSPVLARLYKNAIIGAVESTR